MLKSDMWLSKKSIREQITPKGDGNFLCFQSKD